MDDIAVVSWGPHAKSGTPLPISFPDLKGFLSCVLAMKRPIKTAEHIEFLLVEQEIFVQLHAQLHDKFLEAIGGMEIFEAKGEHSIARASTHP